MTITTVAGGAGRAALALAVARIRRRYLRSALGLAWFFLTPVAIFMLYWMVFGQAFDVAWRNPSTGEAAGYIGPFAVGYSLYLFLADVIGSAGGALRGSAGLLKRGGVAPGVLAVSFGLECLLKFAPYLAIALVLALATGVIPSPADWGLFAVFAVLFMIQAGAIGLMLMFLAPFVADLAEVGTLGLRVFVYAAGLSFPLTVYPPAMAQALTAAPLSGPLNAARDALLFGIAPDGVLTLGWLLLTAALAAMALFTFRRLRRRVLDVL